MIVNRIRNDEGYTTSHDSVFWP